MTLTTSYPTCIRILEHVVIVGSSNYDEIYKLEENDWFSAALNSGLILMGKNYNYKNGLSTGIIISPHGVQYYQNNKSSY